MEILPLLSLLSLPKTAVFGFINDKTNRYYITYSSKFKTRLMTIIEQISLKRWKSRGMINELSNIKLVIFEKNIPEHELKVFTKYYRDQYRNQGYSEYIKEKIPLMYSFSIRFTSKRNAITVIASNSRKESIVLGYFDNLEDAQYFLSLINDRNINPTRNLIYARNRTTRREIIKKYNLAVNRKYIR